MKSFIEFESAILSGKIDNKYFIAHSDNYFLSKASNVLKTKLFGDVQNPENYYIKYADEFSYEDLADLISDSASLFDNKKLLILKRCEKYSRKLQQFFEILSLQSPETYAFYAFDKDFVIEKKLNDKYDFYNFSELEEKEIIKWSSDEFKKQNISIGKEELNLFLSLVPLNFDLLESEIYKLTNYLYSSKSSLITKEIILESVGYEENFTPEDLLISIIVNDKKRGFSILENLIFSKNLSEIYIIAFLAMYFSDFLILKNKNLDKIDKYRLNKEFKIWYNRADIVLKYHQLLNIDYIESCLKVLIETDTKLKSTMTDSKDLIFTTLEQLFND